MSMNPDAVAAWLNNHPDFFEHYSALLTHLHLPHPHDGGHTVSLSQRQVLALREKNHALETRLRELIGNAEINDRINRQVHELAVAMLAAQDLPKLLDAIEHQFHERFAVPQAQVRLWGGVELDNRPEFGPVPVELKAYVMRMEAPYCGPLAVHGILSLFSQDILLKSFAVIPLKNEYPFGVVVLASPDENRFSNQMGTLFLERIGEIIGAALHHRIHASP